MNHEDGQHKARKFRAALGYTAADTECLREAVLAALADSPVCGVQDGYQPETWIAKVDMRLSGPNGRTALVRTEWETTTRPHRPRLTTIFVRR